MHFYTWAFIIVLLIITGVILKRAWLARQADENAPEQAGDQQAAEIGIVAQLTHTLQNRIEGLRNGFGGTEQDIAAQFREWAADAFTTAPDIQTWLDTLSDEQIMALAEHLSEFCRDMGFELSWLLNNQMAQNPELMQGLTQIVLHYNQASYQAVALQGEVEIYRVYNDLVQNPKNRANRELGEHLFGKLVEQDLSDVTIAEHMAASTHQRQQQILETIQRIATEHPQVFNNTLKTVLIERTMPPQTTEPNTMNGTAKATATS